MHSTLLLVAFISFFKFAFSKLLTGPDQLQSGYDFVIVGGMCILLFASPSENLHPQSGGTAGNVIAARLGSIPGFRVLVIEAGIKCAHNLVVSPINI